MGTPDRKFDPVCRMDVYVDAATSGTTSEYEGEKYYFCSPTCKNQFDQDPEHFLSQRSKTKDS